MKKSSKSKNKVSAALRVDPYLEGLMGKLLERLVGVEKKLDIVVAQTAAKPSGNGNPSQPFQTSEAKQPPRKDRTLYEAICADCHQVCEVPFRPSDDRPVYCKQCFAKRKSGGQGSKFPVLTPVALPQKPVSKLGAAYLPPPLLPTLTKKTKKSKSAKKPKKKK